jgi:hypothetical protein
MHGVPFTRAFAVVAGAREPDVVVRHDCGLEEGGGLEDLCQILELAIHNTQNQGHSYESSVSLQDVRARLMLLDVELLVEADFECAAKT